MSDIGVSAAKSKVISGSYLWMGIGLGLSGVTAYLIAASPSLMALINGNWLAFGLLFVVQLALVMFLSRSLSSMSAGMATNSFIIYAILSGATLSSIFYTYSSASIASAFWVSALTFFVMAVYGTNTRADLTRIGNLSLMVLVGIIIASIFTIFFNLPVLNMIISIVSVVAFAILIARDTQQIGAMANFGQFYDKDVQKKEEIIGALGLYLDVINVFYALLNLTSSGGDD